MRLVRTDERKYLQSKENTNEDYRNVSQDSQDKQTDPSRSFFADVLLKQRSLYIMK